MLQWRLGMCHCFKINVPTFFFLSGLPKKVFESHQVFISWTEEILVLAYGCFLRKEGSPLKVKGNLQLGAYL